MIDKFQLFTLSRDDQGRRLDNLLCKLLPHLPRETILKAIRKGDCKVNEQKGSPS